MKFFTHEITSRDDDRLFELIDIHGLEGYGFFWVILEELYRSEDNGFQVNATNVWVKRLARSLNLKDDKIIIEYLDTLSTLGLIDKQLWGDRVIRSQGVIKRSDAYMQRKSKEAEKKRKQRAQAKESSDTSSDVPRDIEETSSVSLDVPVADPDPYSHSYSHSYSNSEKIEKEQGGSLSIFPLTGDKESEMRVNKPFPAQTKNPNIQDPQPPKPPSPATPKNIEKPKPISEKTDNLSREAEVDGYLADDGFRRFLFGAIKRDIGYYSTYAEGDYIKQTKKYIRRAEIKGRVGDDRVEDLRAYRGDYDRYKEAKRQAEEERRQMEEDPTPRPPVDENTLCLLAKINADRRSKGFIFTEKDYQEDRLKESSTIYAVSSRRTELDQNAWVAS